MGVALASTYRDAEARLLYVFEDCVSRLHQLYNGISVVVSPLTYESARRSLTEFGVDVYSSPEDRRVCLLQSLGGGSSKRRGAHSLL